MLGLVASSKYSSSQVYLFIAPGYDEEFVVACSVTLRKAGIRLALVGVAPEEVTGANGVRVHPDLGLDELHPPLPSALMVIPGGTRCVQALTIDPRFHQVLNSAGAGVLVLAGEAQHVFRREQVWPFFMSATRVLAQEDLSKEEFFALLIRFVKVGEHLCKRLE